MSRSFSSAQSMNSVKRISLPPPSLLIKSNSASMSEMGPTHYMQRFICWLKGFEVYKIWWDISNKTSHRFKLVANTFAGELISGDLLILWSVEPVQDPVSMFLILSCAKMFDFYFNLIISNVQQQLLPFKSLKVLKVLPQSCQENAELIELEVVVAMFSSVLSAKYKV